MRELIIKAGKDFRSLSLHSDKKLRNGLVKERGLEKLFNRKLL